MKVGNMYSPQQALKGATLREKVMEHSFSASILRPGFGLGEIARRRGMNMPKTPGTMRGSGKAPRDAQPGTGRLARVGRLEPGQTLKLDIEETSRLRISAGLAWVTLSNDPKDHWLQSGAELAVLPGHSLVISAEHGQDLRWTLVALRPLRPGVLEVAGFEEASLEDRPLGTSALDKAALGTPGRLAALGLAGLRNAASIARRAQGAIRRALSMASLGTVQ